MFIVNAEEILRFPMIVRNCESYLTAIQQNCKTNKTPFNSVMNGQNTHNVKKEAIERVREEKRVGN